MLRGLKLWIVVFIFTVPMSGCEVLKSLKPTFGKANPIKFYPDFNTYKDDITDIFIVMDFAHTYHIGSDKDVFIYDENIKMAEYTLGLLKDYLTKRGYSVKGDLIASLGLSLDSDRNVKKNGKEEYYFADNVSNLKNSKVRRPPFYLDKSLNESDKVTNSINANLLKEQMEKIRSSRRGDVVKLVFPESIAELTNGATILIIQMYSRDASDYFMQYFGADLTASIITSLASGVGMYSGRRPHGETYIDGILTIIDPDSGMVMWSDPWHKLFQNVNNISLDSYAFQLTRRIPTKNELN